MDNYNKENINQDDYRKQDVYMRAKKKLDKLKGFYWHLAAYLVVNIFLIGSIAVNLDEGETIWNFSSFATAIFWGIGLVFHFMGVFGADIFLGKDWEDRKIQEYMDKDKKNWE